MEGLTSGHSPWLALLQASSSRPGRTDSQLCYVSPEHSHSAALALWQALRVGSKRAVLCTWGKQSSALSSICHPVPVAFGGEDNTFLP